MRLSLAGFQVIMYGRFWVITEVATCESPAGTGSAARHHPGCARRSPPVGLRCRGSETPPDGVRIRNRYSSRPQTQSLCRAELRAPPGTDASASVVRISIAAGEVGYSANFLLKPVDGGHWLGRPAPAPGGAAPHSEASTPPSRPPSRERCRRISPGVAYSTRPNDRHTRS